MSLPRARILRTSRQFTRVRAEGTPRIGRFLLLTAVPDPEPESPSLFGFITPRYIGKAHDRNRVRRRLKAIAAVLANSIPRGFHVVTLARRTAGQADFATLEKEWRRLAAKAGLIEAEKRPSKGDSA